MNFGYRGQLIIGDQDNLLVYTGKTWEPAYWDIKKIDGEWHARIIAFHDWLNLEEIIETYPAETFAEALHFLEITELSLRSQPSRYN